MRNFSEFVIKRRLWIIIFTAVITIFFTYWITKLSINSDITSYLKPDDQAMILFNRIGDEYGGNQMVMVAVTADDIVTTGTLNFLKTLTDSYSEIEGISSITSLINIIDIREEDFGLSVGKLINAKNIPQNPQALAALKKYILSRDTYRGKVISQDGTATIIICKLDPSSNKIETAKKIKAATENLKGNYQVYYSGFPVQMMELSSLLLGDLKVLIPIALAVIVLVLYFSFRTLRGVMLPLLIVVISTIWAVGLMGLTGTPMSIISNVVPVILLAIGTAYGIHFMSRYYEDIRTEEQKLPQIMKTVRHITVPIFLTGITTITGFLSFIGAYITAITEFGIFTAVGVMIAMAMSVTFLPAMLSYMKVKINKRAGSDRHPFRILMDKTSTFVLKNKIYVVIFSAAVLILSALIIPKIKTETDLARFFPKKSEIRRADSVINNYFGGSTPVQIVIHGDLKEPLVLREMVTMEKFLEQLPNMTNTLSLADLMARMNDIVNGHKTIPQTRGEIANLLFLLEGDEILGQLVNDDYSEGIIQATYKMEDSRFLSKTVYGIESYIKQNLSEPFYIVSRNELEGSAKFAVEDWINTYVSRVILYDINRYYENPQIDSAALKDYLKAITVEKDSPLIPEIKNEIYSRLIAFFEEESEIIIDEKSEIESISMTLADIADTGQIDRDILISALQENIPVRYWAEYPESISYTADYLLPLLKNARAESAVGTAAGRLIREIFPERAHDDDFKKLVQDDMWLLSRQSLGVPAFVLQGEQPGQESVSINSELSGMITIVDQLNRNLRKSQIQSILIAVSIVFLLLTAQFKSIKMGAVALSPIILVILLNFAIMGYFGIPLDYATLLVGSILIGVGIDYSIHFSSRFRLECKSEHNELKVLQKTLSTTGVAILINALMVALGFFVLIIGNIGPVKREGWMIGVLMILCAFSALVFLPSLVLTLKKFLKLNIR